MGADSLQSEQVYSSVKLTDYYHLYASDAYPQYLYSTNYMAGWESSYEKSSLKAEYTKQHLKGKYSQTDHPDDVISLSMPDESLLLRYGWKSNSLTLQPFVLLGENPGLGLDARLSRKDYAYLLGLGSRSDKLSINYNIRGETGSIPFAWRTDKASIGFTSRGFDASIHTLSVSPVSCDSAFYNAIHSFSIGADVTYRWHDIWKATLASTYIDTDAEFLYHDQIYGDIRDFRMVKLHSALQKVTRRDTPRMQYQLSIDAYFSGIGSETYLEIWPFTYLDTFLAHRTRIKQLGIQALSPGLEATYKSSAATEDGFSWQLGIGYHHLFHKEDVVIRNRRVVLYPFLFSYDTHEYNWEDDVNGYFRIPLQAIYSHKRGSIELNVQQLAPVKWSSIFSKPTPSGEPSTGTKQSQWGGLSCELNLVIPL